MVKKFCGLLIMLLVFGGIFALLSVSYAMNKTDKLPSFGCDAKSVISQKSGKNWIIKWRYDSRLEGTQVKINLYRGGKLLRTITDSVSIGQNGSGSWRGTWDDFFFTSPVKDPKVVKSFSSPDWWVKGIDDPTFNKGEDDPIGTRNKGYQIEIVSLANSNLRVKGDNASWDWGN